MRSVSAKPSRDWLAHVRTGRARHKIRQWLRHEEHSSSVKLGQDILERELKRRREAARHLGPEFWQSRFPTILATARSHGVDPVTVASALTRAGLTSGLDRVGMVDCVRIECAESQREQVRSVLNYARPDEAVILS